MEGNTASAPQADVKPAAQPVVVPPMAPDAVATPPAAAEVKEPTTTPPEKNPDELKFASRFAALSRREREIQKADAEIRKLRDDPDFKSYQEAKKNRDALGVLQSLGMSYGDATEAVLNNGKMEEMGRFEREEISFRPFVLVAEEEPGEVGCLDVPCFEEWLT